MRVLHLISSFGSGGAERQLSLIAPALQASGIETHIAHCTGGPNLARLDGSEVTLHRLQASRNEDPRLLWQTVRLIRRLKPDLVQTWLLQMDVFGGVAAALTRTPWVLSERSSALAYAPGLKNRMRALLGRHADVIVANSNAGLDYWRQNHPKGELALVRNCLPPARGANAAIQTPAGKLVLFVGRLSHDKNIKSLVDAFIDVVNRHPEVTVKLIGEGPLLEWLTERIAVAGARSRIEILGYSDDVAAWMKAATLCVSVSGFEGHPNVVLEAASLGCPLVLSDIPAHREFLDESQALYVEANSVTDIAAGILNALADPDARQDRARKAQVATLALTIDHAAREYTTIYDRLLRRRQGARRKPQGTAS